MSHRCHNALKKENVNSAYEVVLQFKIWIKISIVQYFSFFKAC